MKNIITKLEDSKSTMDMMLKSQEDMKDYFFWEGVVNELQEEVDALDLKVKKVLTFFHMARKNGATGYRVAKTTASEDSSEAHSFDLVAYGTEVRCAPLASYHLFDTFEGYHSIQYSTSSEREERNSDDMARANQMAMEIIQIAKDNLST